MDRDPSLNKEKKGECDLSAGMLIPSVSFYLDVSEKQPHSTIVTEASSYHALSTVIHCAHSVSQCLQLLPVRSLAIARKKVSDITSLSNSEDQDHPAFPQPLLSACAKLNLHTDRMTADSLEISPALPGLCHLFSLFLQCFQSPPNFSVLKCSGALGRQNSWEVETYRIFFSCLMSCL